MMFTATSRTAKGQSESCAGTDSYEGNSCNTAGPPTPGGFQRRDERWAQTNREDRDSVPRHKDTRASVAHAAPGRAQRRSPPRRPARRARPSTTAREAGHSPSSSTRAQPAAPGKRVAPAPPPLSGSPSPASEKPPSEELTAGGRTGVDTAFRGPLAPGGAKRPQDARVRCPGEGSLPSPRYGRSSASRLQPAAAPSPPRHSGLTCGEKAAAATPRAWAHGARPRPSGDDRHGPPRCRQRLLSPSASARRRRHGPLSSAPPFCRCLRRGGLPGYGQLPACPARPALPPQPGPGERSARPAPARGGAGTATNTGRPRGCRTQALPAPSVAAASRVF